MRLATKTNKRLAEIDALALPGTGVTTMAGIFYQVIQ